MFTKRVFKVHKNQQPRILEITSGHCRTLSVKYAGPMKQQSEIFCTFLDMLLYDIITENYNVWSLQPYHFVTNNAKCTFHTGRSQFQQAYKITEYRSLNKFHTHINISKFMVNSNMFENINEKVVGATLVYMIIFSYTSIFYYKTTYNLQLYTLTTTGTSDVNYW